VRLVRFRQSKRPRHVNPELACFYEPRQCLQTGVVRLDGDTFASFAATQKIVVA
jgi:hypothetical protein